MKRLKKSYPNIKITASFVLYCIVLLLIDGPILIACVLFTLLIHEGAHLFVGYLFRESFSELELTPFGGRITYDSAQSSSKGLRGILIAGAGPAANYILLAFASKLPLLLGGEAELCKKLLSVNASMLLLNLLPVLPLDGGRIVFSFLYYLFPIESLLTLLGALGRITGGAFVVLAIYGAVLYGKLNISLIIVGVYIFLYSNLEKKAILIENRYTVLQEKLSNASSFASAQLYLVNHSEPLLNLLPSFCRKEYGVYIIRSKTSECIMTEDRLITAFLKNPCSSAGDVAPHRSLNTKTF